MAIDLSHKDILALAPDPASAQAGQHLARAAAWQALGRTSVVAWGECKGSAATPYRTQVTLDGATPASRCSCPSRKIPCKHVLGLLLLVLDAPDLLRSAEPPAWLQLRSIKNDVQPAEVPPQPTAHASSTLRATAREQRVDAGIEDLRRWLQDLLRQGFAVAQQQPFSFWEQPAARLVDAQAPGLARLVRALPNVIVSGAGWPDRMLQRIARIHLLLAGYARLDTLPEATQADIRTAIGWNASRDEIALRTGVEDEWQIVGRRVSEDDGLRTLRTYLYGAHTAQFALILEFTPAHQPLERTLLPGTGIDAELAFYPSAAPLRALVKSQTGVAQRMRSLPGHSLGYGLMAFAQAIARNPWLEHYPLLLADAVPLHSSQGWQLAVDGQLLPLVLRTERGWQLLALSGGHPLTVFGEWNGETLTPLGVWAEDGFSDIGS